MSATATLLQEQFGQIDIYLFDQILRGHIAPGMTVLDAGCGFGRNLVYLLREDFEVYAADANPEAIAHVKALAVALAPALPADHFRVTALESMPFPDELADAVICSAVLHFARNREHFLAMVSELWRVLKPGGMLFCRLASRIGMEFPEVREDIYRVGRSEWFLVDASLLTDLTRQMGATLIDPLKTTIVQDSRCMTTWVLRKPLQGLVCDSTR